jgi:hypothetical protein
MFNAAHRFTPPAVKPLTLLLNEEPLQSAECSSFSAQPAQGFTLAMQKGWLVRDAKEEHAKPVRPILTLHADKTLPKSRGCPLSYAIADVLSHEGGGGIVYVVLLHMSTIGFEGPDSRFLAVTHICKDVFCGLIE